MLQAIILIILVVGDAAAQNYELRPKRFVDKKTKMDDTTAGGVCEIRVWVDDEVHIRLRGDRMWLETIKGMPGRDAGTECTQPLPQGKYLVNYSFKGIDGHAHSNEREAPSAANDWTAWIIVQHPQKGGEEQHLRISFTNVGPRPGTSVNSATRAERLEPRFDEKQRIYVIDSDGICLYPQIRYGGEPDCFAAGTASTGLGSKTFRSAQLFGTTINVVLYNLSNQTGEYLSLTKNEEDLTGYSQLKGADGIVQVSSLRVY